VSSILKKKYHPPDPPESGDDSRYGGMHCRIALLREKEQTKTVSITGPDQVYELVKDEIAISDREVLIVLLLSTRLTLVGVETVAIGSLNTCSVPARELFKGAILANAASIVLCHNHPSGDLEPSPSDIELTRNMARCGQMLGINIRDHVIVSPKGYRSIPF